MSNVNYDPLPPDVLANALQDKVEVAPGRSRVAQSERVCEHGSLRRSCEICERDERIKENEDALEALDRMIEERNKAKDDEIKRLHAMLDAYRSVVTVAYDDECGEWTAEVVGLPGCIGAGDTAEEAVRTALGFAPGWIETMFERNRARIAELEALIARVHVAGDCPADNQRELPDAAAALIFNTTTPEGERRLRLALEGENLKLVLFEFDWWLRNRIKYNDDAIPEHGIPEDGIEWLQAARDQLWKRCADYGIDLTED